VVVDDGIEVKGGSAGVVEQVQVCPDRVVLGGGKDTRHRAHKKGHEVDPPLGTKGEDVAQDDNGINHGQNADAPSQTVSGEKTLILRGELYHSSHSLGTGRVGTGLLGYHVRLLAIGSTTLRGVRVLARDIALRRRGRVGLVDVASIGTRDTSSIATWIREGTLTLGEK